MPFFICWDYCGLKCRPPDLQKLTRKLMPESRLLANNGFKAKQLIELLSFSDTLAETHRLYVDSGKLCKRIIQAQCSHGERIAFRKYRQLNAEDKDVS